MKRLLLCIAALLCSPGVQADLIKQSSNYHRMVLMTAASDHITGLAGLTLTITESKAGGAFGAATPTVTDRGSGWYDVLLTSADDATLGQLAMHVTGAAADPTDTLDQIVAFDPADVVRLGLTSLPNATAGALNGLPTGDASGRVALQPADSTTMVTGAAQAGGNTSITLASGASAVDNFYTGCLIKVYAGTAAGQVRLVTAYVGSTKVATVGTAWATGLNPVSTDSYAVLSFRAPLIDANGLVSLAPSQTANITGNITGNLSGSVGAVTGAVGSVTGAVGSVTGAVGSVTGNIGGNVTGSTGSISGITFPTRFSSLVIDTSGFVTLAASEHTEIAADVKDGLNGAAPGSPAATSIYADWATLLARVPGTIQPQTGDAYARLGAPAGASTAADIAAVKSDSGGIATLLSRLGVPVGATISADIAGVPNTVWAAGARTLTGQSDSSGVTTLLTRIPGTVQPQTGDSYARLGAPAGASHSADIAAIPGAVWQVATRQLTGTQAFNLTGNVTGNLSGSVGSVTGPVGSVTGAVGSVTGAVGSLSGSVTVGGYSTGFSPKEQVLNLAIPGESGLTYGQALYAAFLNTAGSFGTQVRSTSAPWTIAVPFKRASDGATIWTYTTTYTDSTFARTTGRSYVTASLPSP